MGNNNSIELDKDLRNKEEIIEPNKVKDGNLNMKGEIIEMDPLNVKMDVVSQRN